MTILVQDTFTGTNGTAIVGKTTDIGGKVWARYTVNGNWTIQSNQAGASAPVWDTPNIYVNAGVSNQIAVSVKIPVYHSSSQLYWRSNAEKSFFQLQFDGKVWRVVDDSWTQLGTLSTIPKVGDIVRVELRASEIKIFINGAFIQTYTDSNLMTATNFGLASNNSTTRFDDFTIEDFNTDGTPVTVTSVQATATADTIAPIVTAQKQINVSSVIASITADALAPTITTASSTSASITALSATVTGDALNPSLSAGNTITSVLASVVGDALNPSISIGSNIQNVMGTSIADALSPQVGSFTNISINAVIVSVTADAISPAVDTIRNISIPSILADAAAEALTPNVLARSSSVQIVSVITEALAETLTPSFFQLWREVSLTTVPFTEMSPSIDTAWRGPERTVNYFK